MESKIQIESRAKTELVSTDLEMNGQKPEAHDFSPEGASPQFPVPPEDPIRHLARVDASENPSNSRHETE
ncbi:hypothetical protein ElyMa_005695300 [Elysia marginata]|uniref:Uncharacterized protein n=1 Tax=Elysia marginata TaxID=1093978 RepID=A0AAV4FI33_9GAST|nr:hypothetical protein ElyMa_005695300 [Elysia marginata]